MIPRGSGLEQGPQQFLFVVKSDFTGAVLRISSKTARLCATAGVAR